MKEIQEKVLVDQLIEAGCTRSEIVEKAGVSPEYASVRKMRLKNREGREALKRLLALRGMAKAMPLVPLADALAAVEEGADE
jgi:hypothetical protein